MRSTSRRDFLKLCAASAPALATGLHAQMVHAHLPDYPVQVPPPPVERFLDPLPILKTAQPSGRRNGTVEYHIRMVEFTRRLHSQLPPARLWGYEGQCPGPVIEARSGEPVEVMWENALPERHLFPIDPAIHGAMPPAPAVRTVPHLHGSRTPSFSDGLPEAWYAPGKSVVYRYPNEQVAATLWYHDHALGITRLNVYAGLSGFYLLRDRQEQNLGLPAGDYEIPLLLQDRRLDAQGQLVYTPTDENGHPMPPGVWGPEFFGNLPLVNGAVYPHLEVEPRVYRLRLLNAANSRYFHLRFDLASKPTDVPSLIGFRQIGTDGGLLPKPAPLEALLMGPAERADLLVDFAGHEGKTVTLTNDAASPYPGWDLLRAEHAPLNELMQFRVTRPLTGAPKQYSFPALVPVALPEPGEVTVTRDFVLMERMSPDGKTHSVLIDNKGYDAPVTEFPKLNAVEKWRFINTTDDAHPMHLHLVQFRILERQGFDPVAYRQGRLQLVGTPRPPASNEAGWKDTAVVVPRDVLTILVKFEGYTGKYVFHCHMVEHEDNDMMRPFEVVSV